jgi:hypothetical protein
MGKGTKIGLLNRIFGLGIVAENAAYDPVELPVVALHDQAEGCPVLSPGPLDQSHVIQVVQRRSCGGP